jgi:DUF2946 family protein
MNLGRLKRRAAAWLGLLALGIQILIPLVVAAEIGLATSAGAGAGSVFELCVFGHVHGVAQNDADDSAPGKSHGTTDSGLGAACPICIALHAASPFAAPEAGPLPIPSASGIDVPILAAPIAPLFPLVAAYHSRAPPSG